MRCPAYQFYHGHRQLQKVLVYFIERAVAGAECNTVIELKPEHHAA